MRRLEQMAKCCRWPKIEVLGKLCPVNDAHRGQILDYLIARDVSVILCDSWIGRDEETKSKYPNSVLELAGVMLRDAAEQMARFSGNCWMMTKYKPEVSSKLFDAASISEATGWKPSVFYPLDSRRPRYVDKSQILACKPGDCDYQLRRIADEGLAILKMAEAIELPETVVRDGRYHDLVGRHPAMLELYGLIERLAQTKTSVLITGETGTGKMLVARALHQASPRSQQPYVDFNFSGIPDSLFESEVYGHARRSGIAGSDSGGRPGIFEQAQGGVIFLDEVGDMPQSQQVKLFLILDREQVRPLSATRPVQLNVRIISATNQPLRPPEGRLRPELLRRLGYVIRIPALRERMDDLPLLCQYFLDRYASENQTSPKVVTGETIDALSRHDWPENVGELKNVIEGAAFDARNMPFILPDNPQIRKLASGGRGASIGIGSTTGSFYEWPVENILAGIESGECPVQPISAWADGMGHPKTLQLAEAAIRKFGGGHRHLSDDDAVRLFGMKQHALKTQVIDRRKAEGHG